jgi:hypothetical protein
MATNHEYQWAQSSAASDAGTPRSRQLAIEGREAATPAGALP